MVENLISDPIIGLFGQNLGPNFFCGFYLYWESDIIPIYLLLQFPRKLMNQT